MWTVFALAGFGGRAERQVAPLVASQLRRDVFPFSGKAVAYRVAERAKAGAGERNRTVVISLEGYEVRENDQRGLILLKRQNHPKTANC
jgi:hypothetical protein